MFRASTWIGLRGLSTRLRRFSRNIISLNYFMVTSGNQESEVELYVSYFIIRKYFCMIYQWSFLFNLCLILFIYHFFPIDYFMKFDFCLFYILWNVNFRQLAKYNLVIKDIKLLNKCYWLKPNFSRAHFSSHMGFRVAKWLGRPILDTRAPMSWQFKSPVREVILI